MYLVPHLPRSISQDAFDKLTVDSANQQASAVAAAVTAADQKASFGDQMAKATLDASDQKAQFEGQMAEAKLAAGDMKSAFDKLTLDNTDQIAAFDSHMAQAEHDAARQQAGFDIRMAKAEHDAGGMKVRDWLAMVTSFPSLVVYCTLSVGASIHSALLPYPRSRLTS